MYHKKRLFDDDDSDWIINIKKKNNTDIKINE